MAVNQHGWYTPNERAQHVQSYLSSNLSLTQYSKENNLCKSTLATWLRQYNSANLVANDSFQDITPIVKDSTLATTTNVKLTISNGIVLEFDVSLLHLILEEIK